MRQGAEGRSASEPWPRGEGKERYGGVEFREGSDCLALLADPAFRSSWDALYAACPWATVFQSRAFAGVWYSVYAPVFDPLFVYFADPDGRLTDLLALAKNRKNGELVHAGAHQAEYHAWISAGNDSGWFIEAALDELARRFPRAHLRFQCLPPGAPTQWLESGRWAGRACITSVPRPLMKVGDGSGIAESLRKKSNKSRVNRLQKLLGPLRLEVLECREAIAPIFDQIVEFTDFRAGARFGCLPFHEDPLKREFYLRLVDKPEITHSSVLRAGDEVLAAHIGARSTSAVHVGLITQSPFYSEHSPGKLLFLLLGAELGASGFHDLDLTPWGQYKERFADHSDTAYAGVVYFRHRDAILHGVRHHATSLVKFCAPRTGLKREHLRRLLEVTAAIRRNRPHVFLFKLLRWVKKQVHSHEEEIFFHMDPSAAARLGPDDRFRRDSLADLLLYEQPTSSERTKLQFLRDAYDRLELGAHAYTFAEDKRLAHYAWMRSVAGKTPTTIGDSIDFPPDSITLWDDFTHPASRGKGLHSASIRTRLADAGMAPGTKGRIFISVMADNLPSRHNIERAGFLRYATLVRRIRWGKTSWKWDFER